MSNFIIRTEYKGYALAIEESGNVTIYYAGSFYDKLTNMSEAIDRINKLIKSKASKDRE